MLKNVFISTSDPEGGSLYNCFVLLKGSRIYFELKKKPFWPGEANQNFSKVICVQSLA